MRKMKIGIVTSELFPWKIGGLQNVVFHLVNKLANEVDVVVICLAPESQSRIYDYYHERINFHFIKDMGLSLLRYPVRNLRYLLASESLRKCNIIHFHILPGANCFFLPGRLRRSVDTKLLITLYDWIPHELPFYDIPERLAHILHWQAAKRRLSLFDLFIVNSSYMKDIVDSRGFHPVEVIPNGIDPEDWKVQSIPNRDHKVKGLFWGRLYDKKGVGELLKATSILHELGYDYHLYIAGEGPRSNDYLSLSKSLGLEKTVTFLGPLPEHELKHYLAVCDFCIFPSAYEGFGISILESMAAGKPVITTRRGGQTDFARDGYNSLLVDPGNPAELANAIKEMITNPDLRERLGRNARITASEYSWDKIIWKYLDIYHEVAKGGKDVRD